MNRIARAVLPPTLLLAPAACDQKSPPPPPAPPPAQAAPARPAQPAPQAVTPPAHTAGAASRLDVMGVSFAVPEGWTVAPPANSMRLAELHVGADAATQCLVVFSTAGGTVQSNIDRWAGQVTPAPGATPPAPSTRTVAGLKVTTAEFVGDYAGMGNAAPQHHWMLRGAIVETPAGLLFIKMTGPAEPMTAARPAFDTLVDSLTAR